MSTQPKTLLTPEQYFEIESKSEFKSEYCLGEMFAMAGAGPAHNRLARNVMFQLYEQLRSSPCEVLTSESRVSVSTEEFYTYADALVVCGGTELLDSKFDTVLNPTLIIEVLSPSTEAYDRGRKFEHYKSIESFQQYLLIASDRVHVDLFTRKPDGDWNLKSADRLEDSLELQSIGCRLALADLYNKVELSEPQRPTA
ncbi:MAG TPA: Uma2 family endonuclease [Bryobacteraceae bacterium]|nr:Uma2 family endonuclease [Bryobacteraceae bacterium]